jgi:hypothetical protein
MGYWEDKNMAEFSELKGKTIASITRLEGDTKVQFVCSDGTSYLMYHDQDCCENVYLEDVTGSLEDIISHEVLDAYETSNTDDPPVGDYDESHTWTYYTIVTFYGSITLRWYGSSNGYYSESVSFYRE